MRKKDIMTYSVPVLWFSSLALSYYGIIDLRFFLLIIGGVSITLLAMILNIATDEGNDE